MRFFSTLLASVLGTFVALGLLLVFGSLFVAALVASTSTTTPSVQSGSVLVMDLAGPIPDLAVDDPFLQLLDAAPNVGLKDIKAALAEAASDERIEAVWVRPRGLLAGWATLDEIRKALVEFKASGKPLYASGGDLGMREADYFLASAADSIYSAPGTFFEFNGLSLGVIFYKGLLDKLEIEPTILRAGKFKGAVEPFTRQDLSEENREQLQALVDQRYELLKRTVSGSRQLAEDEVSKFLTDDALITASQAQDAGLLDGLLYDDEIKARFKAAIDRSGELRHIGLSSYKHAASSATSNTGSRAGTIGIVYASGTITGGESAIRAGNVGSSTFEKAMRSVRENENVKAVVVRIDSPGGSATASDVMWRAVDLTAAEKPVVISMADLAASGGYWLATAGDTIVSSPQTITGSIGVFGIHFSLGRMMESKLGITSEFVATSSFADMFSGMTPLDAREKALLERAIDDTYAEFIHRVATSRNMPIERVEELAQGRIWTGQDAYDLGLADVLGGLDEAIAIAAEMADLEDGQFRLLRLPRPKTFLEELTDALMVRSRTLFGSPWEAKLSKEARLFEELVRMQGEPLARMPWDLHFR